MGISPARLTAAMLLALAASTHAESVPNPTFDEGELAPVGWSVGSGTGQWSIVDGNRALVTQGNGDQTSFWRSAPVGFAANSLYRLRFRARRLQGAAGSGTVMSGTLFANRDLGSIDASWGSFTSFFVSPDIPLAAPLATDGLRFGQWHLAGAVAFDDIELHRVQPVHARSGAQLVLGEGESITGGGYTFQAPLRTNMANFSRPLLRHDAGFNTHRWVFGAGDEVLFRHEIGGWTQKQASVFVNVNYHTGGSLVVEARSAAQQVWTSLGEMYAVGAATFDVPADLLSTGAVEVQLRAVGAAASGEDADPGSFQVDDYRYSADVADDAPEAQGYTRMVTVIQQRDPASCRVIDTGALQPGLADSIVVEVDVPEDQFARARAVMTGPDASGPDASGPDASGPDASGQTGRWQPVQLRPGQNRLRLPYRVSGFGDRVLHVQLETRDGITGDEIWEPLWHAELDVRASILHADDYGALLSTSGAVDVWWASSGWKVSTTRGVPTTTGSALYIAAARNEAEAAQLVLRPRQALQGLVVQVTDLLGPRGARLPAGAIDIRRVATVAVSQPSDLTGEAARWPDPLLVMDAPVEVPAERNLALWVRLQTLSDTAPGQYHGTMELRAEGWSALVALHVEVFDFALPDRMTCQTAFGFDPSAVWQYQGLDNDADRRTVLAKYLESFARHHISPYDPAPLDRPLVDWPLLSGPAPAMDAIIEPAIDWAAWDLSMRRAIDDYHFNSFRLTIPGMGGGSYIDRRSPELQGWSADTPQYGALFRGYGRAVQRHLAERGWLDEAFVYWFDEPAPRDYAFVMDGFSRLQNAAPGITRMLTEQVEDELVGGPNLWCPVTPGFDVARAALRREAGERFWWYVCTVPKAPWAGLFIDHAATDLRVWLWQTWQRDIDGILVWATNYWTSGAAYPGSLQDPYADPMSWESTYNAPPGARRPWGNGDGRFLYPPPGAPAAGPNLQGPNLQGPVERIRW
ncbi:MAG: DUF4091 domain-containing protein, partial [bacterium]|nr:DUF4091 domain-containing protein [bacterium]